MHIWTVGVARGFESETTFAVVNVQTACQISTFLQVVHKKHKKKKRTTNRYRCLHTFVTWPPVKMSQWISPHKQKNIKILISNIISTHRLLFSKTWSFHFFKTVQMKYIPQMVMFRWKLNKSIFIKCPKMAIWKFKVAVHICSTAFHIFRWTIWMRKLQMYLKIIDIPGPHNDFCVRFFGYVFVW